MSRAVSLGPPAELASNRAAQQAASERYRIHELLGRGGMAVVHEATDLLLNRRVALKRLQTLDAPDKQRRNLELFEREFHMLSQLTHPRVVQVYDFGVDASGAYYTMELLEGGDLQELAPLPWRRACAVARDACSALSLLHSRRFVHRDVSPRNVRCLPQGPAKLIDFGAMASFGPVKLLVGTPPCCAPESVNLQSLDGRTDLFALGATLYYVLVGRHAYPARTFAALSEAWRIGFPPPSELVPEIPDALDALVLDLLRLEPDARPASAAEVIERLSAIDGEAGAEQLGSAQAYLSTPTLVGRDIALQRVQRRVQRATGPRSRSVLIEGAAGVGRTRFLDACLLDATLAGCTLVRSDADDALSGDYGVARAVARQLFELLPELARATAAPFMDRLGGLLGELFDPAQPAAPASPPIPRPHLQQALRQWLSTLSQQRPFVLAVDDFHAIDEPSAALLALLEQESREHALCLLISADSAASWSSESARKLLQPITNIHLENLSPEESERLLQSLFGVVPNVAMLAHRVQTLCAGNPRDLLRLAQHFVDRGLICYAAGAWTLPSELDAGDLPASLADALSTRIAGLHEHARQLACAFALCPDQSFSFEECRQLGDAREPAATLARLEELNSAELVRRIGDSVRLSQRSWTPLLRAELTPERELTLEHRLAAVFERRDGQEFRAAQHGFRAGDPDHALDLLVAHAQTSQQRTARGPEIFLSYVLSLPEDWFGTFERGIVECDRLARPRRQKFILRSRLAGIMSLLNTHAATHIDELFSQLRRDSGLDDWSALDPNMEPKARVLTALGLAKARYDATPAHERVMEPSAAVPELARAVVAGIGGVAMSFDLTFLRSWPSLTPFAPLSAALEASSKLVEGVEARCTGCSPRARRVYTELLQMLQRPDRAGLDASHAEYVKLGVMNGLGMIEAGLGLASCLTWADQIERSPAYEVNAVLIRRLHCLFQGDALNAELFKNTADRLRIQNSGRQMYEGGHLVWEILAHAMAADLTRMRHVSQEIAPLAKRYPRWVPVLRLATAEYSRMVQDSEKARSEIEQVLALAPAGSHQIWAAAAATHLGVLLDLRQHDAASEHADRYVELAARELDHVPEALQLARALVRAHCEQPDAGVLADAMIERLDAQGVHGLRLGVAHETRARIALLQSDTHSFARHSELCRVIFLAHKNAALTAKYHRLLQEGRRNMAGPQLPLGSTPDSVVGYGATRMELALASCRDEEQRARLVLTVLSGQTRTSAGCLFQLGAERPTCVAQIGSGAQPDELLPYVERYLITLSGRMDKTVTGNDDDQPDAVEWIDASGRAYRPVLLSHDDEGRRVITGVAVLSVSGPAAFVYPMQTAAAVSRFYSSSGATSLILLAD
jgi:Protein kinase domain/AAA ATPase domain